MSLQAPAGAASGPVLPAQGGNLVDNQFLSFHLNGQVYALPLAQVAEITPYQELNQLPHMPRGVEGLLDLRGRVVPVISLRARMGLGRQDASLSRNILVLDLGSGSPVGVLVDAVDAVLTATPEDLVPASPLLAGPEGAWVRGFLLRGKRIVGLLDSRLITSLHASRGHVDLASQMDTEQRLEDSLKALIQLAPSKAGNDRTRVIPQMEEAITHTEKEMSRVLDRVEAMLSSTDKGFQGIVRLKQEAGLGHMKGLEEGLAEAEKLGSRLQDAVFALIQQLQFQDIARQKLERVLNHIRGLQMVMGSKLRDQGRRP